MLSVWLKWQGEKRVGVIKTILMDILDIAGYFVSVNFSFIPRKFNVGDTHLYMG